MTVVITNIEFLYLLYFRLCMIKFVFSVIIFWYGYKICLYLLFSSSSACCRLLSV